MSKYDKEMELAGLIIFMFVGFMVLAAAYPVMTYLVDCLLNWIR